MSYYSGQGDYYSGQGDPGIFSFIGKAVGSVAKFAGGLLPGPLGGIAKGIGGILAPSAPQVQPFAQQLPFGGPRIPLSIQGIPTPGIGGAVQRALPGGASGYQGCYPGYHLDKATKSKCVRNRSMNPANPKALRRAIRRQAGFVNLAKRTLKGSGYTFKRTGPPKSRSRR